MSLALLIISDRQADNVVGRTIGAYYCISLPIYQAGVRFENERGYMFRDPDAWLSVRMVARMVGVPILLYAEGDETSVPEYPANCVGTILSAYIEGDQCWAECRIFSRNLADFLADAEGVSIEAELITTPGENTETFDDEFTGDAITVEPLPACVNFLTMRLLGDD